LVLVAIVSYTAAFSCAVSSFFCGVAAVSTLGGGVELDGADEVGAVPGDDVGVAVVTGFAFGVPLASCALTYGLYISGTESKDLPLCTAATQLSAFFLYSPSRLVVPGPVAGFSADVFLVADDVEFEEEGNSVNIYFSK
jgi:hypothetical protein